MSADRHSSNPVFNNRKLKLGTFQSNLDYGCLMSDVEGRLQISWPSTVTLAKLADEMDFDDWQGAVCVLVFWWNACRDCLDRTVRQCRAI